MSRDFSDFTNYQHRLFADCLENMVLLGRESDRSHYIDVLHCMEHFFVNAIS